MMKKRLLSAVMASAMVLSLAACGGAKTETTAAETTAEKKEETTTAGTTAAETAEAAGGTLIVGFDQDFPPMGFVGDNGEYTGFDLDLAKEVASRLGLEYKAQPVAWDSKDMELESGNIDCIWNGFTITGREDDYTWTTPYMANKQVFVVANDSDIKSQADLAGKVVEVQADSSAEAALKENQDLANTFGQLLTTPDYNTTPPCHGGDHRSESGRDRNGSIAQLVEQRIEAPCVGGSIPSRAIRKQEVAGIV